MAREEELAAHVTYPVGAETIAVEVRGRVDLVLERPDYAVAIVDLKTGRIDQRSAFSQLAIYAWLAHSTGWDVSEVMILWAPRGRLNTVGRPLVTTHTRPAAALLEVATSILRHVAHSADNPVAAPGHHCRQCANVRCPFNPETD